MKPAPNWSDYEGAWLVAGTQERFPANSPAHKYAALFHSDSVFDSLRFSFIVAADAGMTLGTFRDRLHNPVVETDAAYLTDAIMAALAQLTHAADAFAHVGFFGIPWDFADRAWPAYLETMMDPSYYFSIEELIVMASVARITLVVFNAQAGDHQQSFKKTAFGWREMRL